MIPSDQAVAIDGIRQFLKLHATCGGTVLDTPDLPGGIGYRAVAACRCGDTAEYWMTDALFPRQQLMPALTKRPAA